MKTAHILLSIVTLLHQGHAFTIGQTVNTTSGKFYGHVASGTNGVSEYLGIPYASAPVGNLRFAAPVRAPYSTVNRSAASFTSCPANSLYGPGGFQSLPFASSVNLGQNGLFLLNLIAKTNFQYTEDCLQVNVWTKPQTGEAKKAVMVWIYGGGFNLGSNADGRYQGKHLADLNDVVVVSINYRTNIFGFPGAPNTRQNLGLLDQRMGLEWVRDNIALFGGDPSRITLFGQSAGSLSLDFYAQAWTADPIVSAFILESGSIQGPFHPVANASKVSTWNNAAKNAGCTGTAAAILTCMRSKSFQTILAASAGSSSFESLMNSVQFWPEVDNTIVFADYNERFTSGRFIKKPTLIGVTDNEVAVEAPNVHAITGIAGTQVVYDFANQAVFNCPQSLRANASAGNGVPTWRYRWFGYYDNTALGQGLDSTFAYHESEVSTVFGTSADFGKPNTATQTSIQQYTMNAWTTFAKNPQNGLNTLAGWVPYSTSNPRVNRIAYQNQTGVSVTGAIDYDLTCPLYAPLALDPLTVLQIVFGNKTLPKLGS